MSETKRNLSDFFVREQLRDQQESQLRQSRFVRESQKDPELDGSKVVQAREGFGDYFSAGLQIGRSQLETDIKRFQAIGNLFIGDDQAANYRLSEARIIEGYNEGLFKELEPFADFLEEPTFSSLSEQAGKAIGQFAPLALTSLASGFAGATTAVLGRGAFTASSRAGLKELYTKALKKKKLDQTLSPEEEVILQTSKSISRYGVGGGVAGAFSQEQIIGSAQALAEFEDAGRELTASEAAAATALGIPQAVLGTVSEGLFAASLFKLAFRKSPLGAAQNKQKLNQKLDSQEEKILDIAARKEKGAFVTKAEDDLYKKAVNPGNYFGNVMKDVANATAASATAESITELGQEEILIQQRKAIDPEYPEEEARLRRMESAFAGFFAGGARAGVAAPVSSVFRTAREQLQQVREDKEYSKLREEQYGPMSGMPIPETKKQLEAQIKQFKEGKKDAIYVSEGMEFSSEMLTKAGISNVDSITVPGIGTFITNNPDKFSILTKARAENNLLNNEFLSAFLNYSNVGRPTDDLVVIVKEPNTGETIEQQTTDSAGEQLAIDSFRERYGPDVIIETEIVEDAVKDKKVKNDLREREEGGTIDKVSGLSPKEIKQIDQELGIEEAFGLSTPQEGSSFLTVTKKTKGKEIGEVDTFNLIDEDTFENYSTEAKERISNKRDRILADLTDRQTREETVLGENISREVETVSIPQATRNLVNQLNEGAMDKYLNYIDRSPSADISFDLGPDNKVRLKVTAQSGILSGAALTEQEVVKKALSKARQSAYKDDNKTIGYSSETKDFKWFIEIPGAQNQAGSNNNTPQKPINMNVFLQEGRKLWLRDTDSGTRNSNSYKQQLALGFSTIFIELSQLENASGNITVNYLDKNTGETFNLSDRTATDNNTLARVPIYFDAVEGKYLSLTELSKQELDPLPTAKDDLVKLAGRIIGANTRLRGIQARPSFEKFKGQGVGTPAARLDQFDPSSIDLYRVENLKQTVTVNLNNRNVTIKDGDIIDNALRDRLRSTNVVPAQTPPVLTVKLPPEGPPIRAKKGVVDSQFTYEDILIMLEGSKAVKNLVEELQLGIKKPQFEDYVRNRMDDIEEKIFKLTDFAESTGIVPFREQVAAIAVEDYNVPGIGGMTEIEIGRVETLRMKGVPLTKLNVEISPEALQYQRDMTEAELRRTDPKESNLDKVERKKVETGETRLIGEEGKGIQFARSIAAMFTTQEESQTSYEQRRIDGVKKVPAALIGLKAVVNSLGVKNDTFVISSRDSDLTINLTGQYTNPETGNSVLGLGGINAYIRKQQEIVDAEDNPNNFAKILQFGNANVIIIKDFNLGPGEVNPPAAEVRRRVLSLGHELGHAFYFQEIDNLKDKPSYQKVVQAYERVIAGENPPPSYLGKYGIEEFFADQFALASIERLNKVKPKTVEASFFHRLVKSMEQFFKSLTGFLQQRYGQGITPEFNEFIQEVNNTYRNNSTNPNAGMGAKAELQVRDALFEVSETAKKWLGGKKTINKINKQVQQVMESSDNTNILERLWYGTQYLLLPADNYIGSQGKRAKDGASKKAIANLRKQAYTISKTEREGGGYVNTHSTKRTDKINELLQLPELQIENALKLTEAEANRLNAILLEAEKTEPAAEYREAALAVKSFLGKFWQDVLRKNGVPFRENYFPRALDLFELANDPNKQQDLVNLLIEANPEVASQPNFDFNLIVAELIKSESDATLDNLDVPTDEAVSDIAVGSDRVRSEYFKNISNEKLREIGVLLPPTTSMFEYINSMVKRTEFNDAFTYSLQDLSAEAKSVLKQRDITFSKKATREGTVDGTLVGWKAVEAQLAEIKDEKIRQEVRNTLKSMFGKSDTSMRPWARNTNSFFLTLNVITYLTFAPLASAPDLAGPILWSGDYKALTKDLPNVVKQMLSGKNGRDRLRKLSLDVGVNGASALHLFYINAAEQNYVGPNAKRIQDVFFKYTGLEAFTRFTRYYAAGMAESFMIRAAEGAKEGDTILAAQLKSLGLTPEQVEAWQKDGGNFELHPEVKAAHAKFVDESIVRPNSAERPAWASSPYFALVWQLKSFFYAYGKNIMMGLYRTAQMRGEQAGLNAMSAPLILGAVTLMPLTMIGLELRELIKYLAAGGDPDKLRTNTMDWPEYSFEILDRSGTLGPFGLLIPAIEAERYGDEFWISPLGPTAERFEDLIQGDTKFSDALRPENIPAALALVAGSLKKF